MVYLYRMMPAEKELTLHIFLIKPPPGVPYGLQKGSGSNFITEQRQTSQGSDLLFSCTIWLKQGEDGQPDFGGPYVQGPVGKRFIYIGIGKFTGLKDSPWERRLKIPLSGITHVLLAQGTGRGIRAFIAGTDRLGGPACATPKPFDGWRV